MNFSLDLNTVIFIFIVFLVGFLTCLTINDESAHWVMRQVEKIVNGLERWLANAGG